jgi:eukaryotic-like serine/threonine-protein kinase
MPLEKNHFYRFGSFRLDPAKRLLLRGQKSVPLMPKAFDTLLVLVENRDRMVGKEELMKSLWPDSFVEEANLAQNVAVLRKTLGDSPEEHRYILTIPGRGYRFAAKVNEETEEEETDLVVERHSRSRVLLEESTVRKPRPAIFVAFSNLLKRRGSWIVGGIALAVFILVVVWLWTLHRPPPLGESDFILVSDFVNTTGEPIFDGSLKQALKVKLSESPYFSITDDSKVRETLRLMGRSPDERLVLPIAREVCERSGAKIVIGGSILRLGNKVRDRFGCDELPDGNVLESPRDRCGATGPCAQRIRASHPAVATKVR